MSLYFKDYRTVPPGLKPAVARRQGMRKLHVHHVAADGGDSSATVFSSL
jgi:hypothetical protein